MKKPAYLLSLCGLMILGCKKTPLPNDPPINENELITTVVLQFKDSLNQTQSFKFSDLDGPGGNVPIIDTIRLKPQTVYQLTIDFLDESKSPVDSITNEIKDENDNHLIAFSSALSQLKIDVTDQDNNGLPLGLKSLWQVLGTGKGIVRIELKHQVGIKNGDPTLGETDVQVDFPIILQ